MKEIGDINMATTINIPEKDIINFIRQFLGPEVQFTIIEDTRSELNEIINEFIAKTNAKIEIIKHSEFYIKCYGAFCNKYFVNTVRPYLKIEALPDDTN